MPSKNERARWESWFEQVDARMRRQKASLDRVVLLLTEGTAALMQIQAMCEDGESYSLDDIHERATAALDVIRAPAAAAIAEIEESARTEAPIEDPRRSK